MATSPATQEKVLSDDQVAFYQRHGYLILKNVLSASELQELQAASGRLRDERARLAGDDRLAVIQNVALFDDAFMMAAKHPVMLGAVTQLIGENLRLQHCKLNWKPPAKGKGEVGWHQDFPFFPHTNYDLLACMFLLDDAVPENGCMRMIPGSHLRGPVDHYDDDSGKFTGRCTEPREYEDDVARGNIVDLIVPAGSMTIHHCCMLHASYPNHSDTPRRGLVYQIAAGDSIQLGGNLHKVWPIWLQGENPLQARIGNHTVYRLSQQITNVGSARTRSAGLTCSQRPAAWELEPSADWQKVTQD